MVNKTNQKLSIGLVNTDIRKALPADVHQLVRLCADHAAFEKSNFEPSGQEERLTEALFGESSMLNCMVIEQEEQLIGYVTFMKQYATWEADFYVYMDCLYLSPSARNLGLGQKLMDEVERYARSENCQAIQWQTPTWNEGAIRFYERNGAISKSKMRFTKVL